MKIIYIHGLDSTANSVKGLLLEKYCRTHHPNIEVIRPDLNQSPDRVLSTLCALIESLKSVEGEKPFQTVLMGSSLGGYFASLVSNKTGCPAILLNPSTQPHLSLQRFVDDSLIDSIACDDGSETVLYRTTGGWSITLRDLDWFGANRLEKIVYPERLFVVIKQGDELLNPKIAADFYEAQSVKVMLQSGGDHRMTDFEQLLPKLLTQVLDWQKSN